MTRLLQSLSTLRRLGHPSATQDSLLAADHALPGGIGYPQGYSKRFQKFYISSSFSRLILALGEPSPIRGTPLPYERFAPVTVQKTAAKVGMLAKGSRRIGTQSMYYLKNDGYATL